MNEKRMIDIPQAIATARSVINVPFVHQGRDPSLGLDCIGLLLHTLQGGGWQPLNEETALHTRYGRLPSDASLLLAIENEADKVSEDIATFELQPLDLLLIRYENDTRPRHVAIVTEINELGVYIIHTHTFYNRVTEHRLSPEWERLVVAIYRLKELNT